MSNLRLPFEADQVSDRDTFDREARRAAVDPSRNVVLSASAGTGKTRVLVDRYVSLLVAGVDPANILAITFTRKAAAEMRQRVVDTLASMRAEMSPARWRDLSDRLGDVSISTIDAFCLSLLREFPLEADLDPGFTLADETEVPRLVEEALDDTLRTGRTLARDDEYLSLLFAQLGERKMRAGLASLLDRRLVATASLRRFVSAGPRDLTAETVSGSAAARLRQLLTGVPGGLEAFLNDGPVHHPRYGMLAADIRRLCAAGDRAVDASRIRASIESIREHFLTNENTPRRAFPAYNAECCDSSQGWRRHRETAGLIAPEIKETIDRFRRDLNTLLARGAWRIFRLALAEYRRTLDAHAVLDFSDVLARAVDLLGRMDEFAQSRYRLESRYHHVLVDEFQDTSRAQWRLIQLLIRSWGEGAGLPHDAPLPPSIFIVGDRKQSIYGFRDADVRVFRAASAYIDRLRPASASHRSISRSFRAVPGLLSFINDLFVAVDRVDDREDRFEYGETDRFPAAGGPSAVDPHVLGVIAAEEPPMCVERVAGEIVRLLMEGTVRDRQTGLARRARAGDIAILFRSREGHREFEAALQARDIPTYVYKGLGFFDADEIKDVLALLRYLAAPESNARAAAFLRSRLVRVSDGGLRALAPHIAAALTDPAIANRVELDREDRRVLALARAGVARWLALVDRVPPSDLLELVLAESAYPFETSGPRHLQARENLKKIRSLVRRIQNRGYATLDRIASHLDRLSTGDESNAIIDATDAVSLMTVHAAKGLEFPVIFVVNLAKGTGGRWRPIRVSSDGSSSRPEDEEASLQSDDSEEDTPWIALQPDEALSESIPGPGRPLPSVAVGPFHSEADEDAQRRDREETKRLLYVAVTRARDRLYLSTVLKDGRLQPGRGSLADVVPDSLRDMFAAAATTSGSVTWTGATTRHTFDVCGPPDRDRFGAFSAASGRTGRTRATDNFAPLTDPTSPVRVPVTGQVSDVPPGMDDPLPCSAHGSRLFDPGHALLGTLIHRLFQFGPSGPLLDEAPDVIRDRLRSLVRPDEQPVIAGSEAILAEAAEMYQAIRRRPEVRSLLDAGECAYEVPFSMWRPGNPPVVLRGSIDCLVREPGGSVTVVELKTGVRRPEHAAQLAVYVEAARELFPDSPVNGVVIYPK